MSGSEERRPAIEFPKFDALEAAVRRVLRQLEVWRERASASEAERRRLKAMIDEMQSVAPELDPSALVEEIERLRAENEQLRHRLREGRSRVEKLVREVEFLEDAR